MGHIFISYSHADQQYVDKLHAALLSEGFNAWIDGRINYGDQWPKVIQQHLDECDAFIIVMSRNSFESDMVQNELTRAREKKKPIFPILLDGDSWLIVQAKQYVDVRDGSLPTEKFYKRLEAFSRREPPVESEVKRLEKQAIQFELAGGFENALKNWQQIKRLDPHFPRIDQKIDELKKKLNKPTISQPRSDKKRTPRFLGIMGIMVTVIVLLGTCAFVVSQLPIWPTSEPPVTQSPAPLKTATAFLTETATPRPTLVPPEKILLYEDFTGSTANWTADNWGVGEESGGNSYWWPLSLDPNRTSYAWYNGDTSDWSDYVFESQVQIFDGGSLSICVRANDEKAYYAVVLQQSKIWAKQYVLSPVSPQTKDFYTSYTGLLNEEKWHTVRVEIKENILLTFVDGQLVRRDELPEPLVRADGGVGFIASGKVYVDSIRVWSLR